MLDIYLDIDGVLLINEHTAAPHVEAFVDRCIEKADRIYWLTTWCKEDSTRAIWRLRQTDMAKSTIAKLELNCKPTVWVEYKTEAIDSSRPFLWFDDDVYLEETNWLKQRQLYENRIKVDLHNSINHLQELTEDFPTPVN